MPRILHISLVLLSPALLIGCAGPGTFKERLNALKPGGRTTAREHYRAAVTFERMGRFDKAADSYAAALLKDPESESARDGMTRAHRKVALQEGHSTVPVTGNRSSPNDFEPRTLPRGEAPVFTEQPPGFARVSENRTPRFAASTTNRYSLQSIVSAGADDQVPEFAYRSPRAAMNLRQITERTAGNGPDIIPHDARQSNLPARKGVTADSDSIPYPASPQALSPLSRESLPITRDIAQLQARLIDNPSDVAAIEQLIQKLADRDGRRQWLATSILDHLARGPQRPVVVAQLARGLRHPDPEVRLQSAVVLATLGSAATEALPNLRLALQDPDDAVRRASSVAIDTIGR